MDNLLRRAPRGVHTVHRERLVRLRDLLGGPFCEYVPAGGGLVTGRESAAAFVLGAHEVVRGGLWHIGRQDDAETGAEGVVVGQTAGEVAVHDDRDTGGQVPVDVVGGCEQRGEVERHAGLYVVPCVDLPPQRLIERRHSGDEYRSAGGCKQRRHGGFAGPA